MFNTVINLIRKIAEFRKLRIDEYGEDAELIKMLKIEHKNDWQYAYFKLKKIN
jgi:hypothetical protein